MPQRANLARTISSARESRGLDQSEAARLTAVSLKTYQSWEAGKTLPRPNKLHMLAGIFGVPLLALITGDGEAKAAADDSDRVALLERRIQALADKQREVTAMTSSIASELAELRRAAGDR